MISREAVHAAVWSAALAAVAGAAVTAVAGEGEPVHFFLFCWLVSGGMLACLWTMLLAVWAGGNLLDTIGSRRADRLLRRGLCPGCRYNLTGNVSGVCPECGGRFASQHLAGVTTVGESQESLR